MTQRPGPLPGALGVVTRPAAAIYRRIITARNTAYDAGKNVRVFDLPVISVGNLSVGGTGKTPMTMRVVAWLLEAGSAPCIAMRGYASSRPGQSDEAQLYTHAFPGVPVVAQPDRAAGIDALRHDDPELAIGCIVLDDGFQHRKIARDLDVVLIDASKDPRQDHLLPRGWLREPPTSLARASATVLTHVERSTPALTDDLIAWARSLLPAGAVVATCAHAWAGLTIHEGDRPRPEPLGWADGKRLLPICAIGSPGPFIERARAVAQREPASPIILRDHHPYTDETARRIRSAAARADAIITTAKDWTKLRRHAPWPIPVAVADLSLAFERGEDELRSRVITAAASPRP